MQNAPSGSHRTGRSLSGRDWWRGRDLNPRPRAYESPALPLSYLAVPKTITHPDGTLADEVLSVLNFKTAEALGLTIPQSVLAQATEIIKQVASRRSGDILAEETREARRGDH